MNNRSFLDSVSAIAKKYPANTAVVAEKNINYFQLDDMSNRVACYLTQSNIKKGSLIAIYMERSTNIIISLLGIMKYGCAYTIVEVSSNIEENINRLKMMPVDLIITDSIDKLSSTPLKLKAISLELCNNHASIKLEKLDFKNEVAYVIFTSGTTGHPKGVAISHDNISHYVESVVNELELDKQYSFAHVSTFSADLGNTSLFLSMYTGGILYIVNDEIKKDPLALINYLIQNNISFLKTTPSYWHVIFHSIKHSLDKRISLEYLLLGGETLAMHLAKETLEYKVTKHLVNHYGPTETTIGVALNKITCITQLIDSQEESVPIGKPFGTTEFLVQTSDGEYKKHSACGELYIGGPSVGIGYLNNPSQTAQVFLEIIPGKKFYRTGDYVSIDKSGIVNFLGRLDRQVKINGYRVELEHIENTIRNSLKIDMVFVYYIPISGKNVLVAALLNIENQLSLSTIKNKLIKLLPDYMIPHYFEFFDNFLLNENGKLDSKKIKELVENRLKENNQKLSKGKRVNASNNLKEIVRTTWANYLGHYNFEDDDNFFHVGGDSLTAIQVLSELQINGYPITAVNFLADPTVNMIVTQITFGHHRKPQEIKLSVGGKSNSKRFSPIQHWFFNKKFNDENYWNQSILLQATSELDISVLENVFSQFVKFNPLLRTVFTRDGDVRQAQLSEHINSKLLTVSLEKKQLNKQQLTDYVYIITQQIQREINITQGVNFRAHVFKINGYHDQLLLISHHIVIDMVSWNILISDLARFYSLKLSKKELPEQSNAFTYWDWVDHIYDSIKIFEDDMSFWGNILPNNEQKIDYYNTNLNLEMNAKTAWLGFSKTETLMLLNKANKEYYIHLSTIILGVFVYIFSKIKSEDCLVIDIESHGRKLFTENNDISRVIGWFTSIYPLPFEIGNKDLINTVLYVNDIMLAVPNLGISYGLSRSIRFEHDNTNSTNYYPKICYNYLGNVDFGDGSIFVSTPSLDSMCSARGAKNDRVHELKLTGRIIKNCLFIDISYPQYYPQSEIQDIMYQMKQSLMSLSGQSFVSNDSNILFKDGSNTGLINYVPVELFEEVSNNENWFDNKHTNNYIKYDSNLVSKKQYDKILITGVTGFIGIHILRLLLLCSNAQIYCLIRQKNDESCLERLSNIFNWYFPAENFGAFSDRVIVIPGDIESISFGLDDKLYDMLCWNLDAIYHTAADTRLFITTNNVNIKGTKTAVSMASTGRIKDLHYMSTLAISGINNNSELMTFSEDSFNVEQEFQNEYESTKFEAEELLHNFIEIGGSGYIYRLGNVSANSVTGKFQYNSQDNRFVQFVAALAALGKAPKYSKENIVLSPVDIVVSGIVNISLDSDIKSGVFHIDSHCPTPLKDIFSGLIALGFDLELVDETDFRHLFSSNTKRLDPKLALGYFWSTRGSRRVAYDNKKTNNILKKHGVKFEDLNQSWIEKFLSFLVAENVLNRNIGSE